MFSGAGGLGIGRMLTTLVQPSALRGSLTELTQRHQRGEDSRDVVECACTLSAGTRETLPGRMRLVIEQDGSSSGYVLVLGGDAVARALEPAARQDIDLLERPAFYDFDLFDQDLNRDLLATPLRGLNLVVFDTETTGLEPSRGDEIVQIDVYISNEVPGHAIAARDRVLDLVRDIESSAGGSVEVSFIDPQESDKLAEEAEKQAK